MTCYGSVDGKYILSLGFEAGPHIPAMVERATECVAHEYSREQVIAELQPLAPAPKIPLGKRFMNDLHINMDIGSEGSDEEKNWDAVLNTMEEALHTPMVKIGATLPDACPAGSVGTIPVGGVIASEAIHPGMHSSDVCCSMAVSTFLNVSPKELMERIAGTTHFGPGGRDIYHVSDDLADRIVNNPFTKDLLDIADSNMCTQGDGNHFSFVGTSEDDGSVALVTHHGSRGFGARVFKNGMRVAERYRQKLSPETLKQNAWIPADTQDGDDYWEALQIVRQWTKDNHFYLHDAARDCGLKLKLGKRFWNEHNFVFRKSDGLFYHAKGATPAFEGWADDASGLTIVPMNMAEPILITEGLDNPLSLGFSPHGAGRNYSRTQHKKRKSGQSEAEIFAEETKGLDVRFFMGNTDISELPSAYKNAASVKRQIEHYELAVVVDEIHPYGSIMAGDWQRDAPWRKKKSKAPAGLGQWR